ncbi:hypothetical protein OIV83_000960 [Microbotryomycetes sp. JL201]|nr:hypothetical protein OIV83_000960 [Microbotryomycetes sp. JL201]
MSDLNGSSNENGVVSQVQSAASSAVEQAKGAASSVADQVLPDELKRPFEAVDPDTEPVPHQDAGEVAELKAQDAKKDELEKQGDIQDVAPTVPAPDKSESADNVNAAKVDDERNAETAEPALADDAAGAKNGDAPTTTAADKADKNEKAPEAATSEPPVKKQKTAAAKKESTEEAQPTRRSSRATRNQKSYVEEDDDE